MPYSRESNISISFLIVNYFSASFTVKLCESINNFIKAYTYEILIFDNSDSSSERAILNKLMNASIEYSKTNIGFVKGNNFLMNNAKGQILVLINPDTLLIDNSLENIFNKIINHDEIGIIGPKLLNFDLSYQTSFFSFPTFSNLFKEHILLRRHDPYTDLGKENIEHVCEVIKGACLVIKKNLAIQVGLFDEDYVMFSEEVDLCYRVKSRGFNAVYSPASRIIHFGSQSSSDKKAKFYTLYHYYRSRLVYYKKHFTCFYYLSVRTLLMLSLLEKSLFLFFIFHFFNSYIHFRVFCKIFFVDLSFINQDSQ